MLVKHKQKLIVGNTLKAKKFYVLCARVILNVSSPFSSLLLTQVKKDVINQIRKTSNEVAFFIDQAKSGPIERDKVKRCTVSRVDHSMSIRKWISSERQPWNLRNVIVHGYGGGRRTNYIKGPHTTREKGQVAADRARACGADEIYTTSP